MDIAYSVNRVPIRLTDERWEHIIGARDDLIGYRDDCRLFLPQYEKEENHLATLTKKKDRKTLTGALCIARLMAGFPVSSMWVDYDAGADVLYLSFQRPQKATNTVEEDDDGILVHYRGKEIVGITILDASKR